MEKSITNINHVLSPREHEVLRLISTGYKRDEIAHKMQISKLTYDGYRKNIRMKLGIKNQADWMKVLYQISIKS
ncbi:MAG: hypothetical protein CMB80_27390 [Flammeovirgaceae bacterium]|nr:hypothetical protein [Flammeovirgaceae bacterium]MBR08623.1 hypothetical protein [Rickettsiales bacterium]|tara:strand:+ start:365 stop:586 length:222 start_codon:yes stop_codon:yes gene_type:complete